MALNIGINADIQPFVSNLDKAERKYQEMMQEFMSSNGKIGKTLEQIGNETAAAFERTNSIINNTAHEFSHIGGKLENTLSDVARLTTLPKGFEEMGYVGDEVFKHLSSNARGLYEELVTTQQSMADVRKSQSALDEQFSKGTITLTEYVQATSRLDNLTEEYQERSKKLNSELKANKAIFGATSGSINDMSKRLSALKDAYNNLSKAERNSEIGKKLAKDIKAATKELQESEKKFESFGDKLKDAFGGLLPAVGAIASVQTLKNMVGTMVQVRSEFQQLEVSFRTMLGSEDKATKLMDQLVQTAAKTPFDMQGVTQGAKQLLAYGISADEVNETLVRLGDIAAGLSLPLGDLVYLYGTTMVQGRMFTQDLKQFRGRGIDIGSELAKQFGVAEEKVGELVTAGKVGAEEFKKAIWALSSEGGKFGGLMKAQSKTIGGQISNIGDGITQIWNDLGKKSEGIINDVLSGASYVVENYEKIGKVLLNVLNIYGAYRAGLIIGLGVEKAVIAVKSAKTAATIAETAATAANTAATNKNNLAKLNNPYIAITVAVLALTAGLVQLARQSDLTRETMQKLKKVEKENNKEMATEISALARLKGEMEAAGEGAEQWKKAKEELVNKFGKYKSTLDKEITDVNSLNEVYNTLTTSIQTAWRERMKLKSLTTIDEGRGDAYSTTYDNIIKRLNKTSISDERKGEISFILNDILTNTDWKTINEQDIFKLLPQRLSQEDMRKINGNDSIVAWGKQLVQYQKSVLKFNKEEAEINAKWGAFQTPDLIGPMPETNDDKSQNLGEKYRQAEKAYKEAKDLVAKIEKNRDNYTDVAYQKAKDDYESAKKEYQKLGGDTSKGAEKKTTESIDKYEKFYKELETKGSRAAITAQNNIAQAEIDAQEDGYAKSMKLLDHQNRVSYQQLLWNYQDQIKSIEENEKEKYKAAHNGSLEGFKFDKENNKAVLLAQKQFNNDSLALSEIYWTNYFALEENYEKELAQSKLSYLQQYGTLEEQRLAIIEEYAEKIADARKEGDEYKEKSLIKERDSKLFNLDLEGIESLKNAFSDVEQMTREKAVSSLEVLRAKLQETTDPEQIKIFQEQISKLEKALNSEWSKGFSTTNLEQAVRYQYEANQYADQAKIYRELAAKASGKEKEELQSIAKQYEDMSKKSKENAKSGFIGAGITTFVSGMKEAANAMAEIAAANGDEKLAQTAEQLSGVADGLSSITQGFAQGGVLGAAAAGVQWITKNIIDAFVQTKKSQAEFLKNQKDFADALVLNSLSLESNDNIFGVKMLNGAIDAMAKALEAKRRTREAVAELYKIDVKTLDKNWWSNLWGNKDEYTNLRNLAPQIFDNGLIDTESARDFLQTNTQITEEQRKQIENAIALQEAYEEAMKSIEDTVSNFVGGLADDMATQLWDAVKNGESAWDDWQQTGSQAISKLGKQMISEMIQSAWLNQYKDRLVAAFGGQGSESPEEVLSSMFANLDGLFSNTEEAVKKYQEWMEAKGLELEADSRQGSSKSAVGASQDSVDESNARLTTIQGHTFSINETVKDIKAQNEAMRSISSSILEEVIGIHKDTNRLASIENDMRAVKGSMRDLEIKGIKLRN